MAYWALRHPVPAADLGPLLSQFGGERGDVDKVVGTFLENAPEQLAEVRAAVEAKDSVRLGKAAHRLKGALSVVTAEVARCIAEQLEEAAKAGDLPKIDKIAAWFEEEMRRVMEHLLQPPADSE